MKLLIFLIPILICFADPCADIHFSPYAGAENIITLHEETKRLENLVFPHPKITIEDLEHPEDSPHFTNKNQWLRKAKSIVFGIPLNAACLITQHEVFGHGYRMRDLGEKYGKVDGYKMEVLGGATSLDFTEHMTTSLMVTVDIAGLEADAVLANKVRLKWLNQGFVEGRQALLYFFSSLSLPNYALSTFGSTKPTSSTENDLIQYAYYLNATYPEGHVSFKQIKYLSLLSLLNPFVFYSALAQTMYDAYCIPTKIFMIPIGKAGYLPSFRMALSPFGLQGYLENFLVIDSITTSFYFKWGKNGDNIYWGAGFENADIVKWKTGSLGLRIDLWQQPNILFEQGNLSFEELQSLPAGSPIPDLYPTFLLSQRKVGAAFAVISSFGAARWPVRVFTELGYKMNGYLPGEALREAPIVRGGFSGQF